MKSESEPKLRTVPHLRCGICGSLVRMTRLKLKDSPNTGFEFVDQLIGSRGRGRGIMKWVRKQFTDRDTVSLLRELLIRIRVAEAWVVARLLELENQEVTTCARIQTQSVVASKVEIVTPSIIQSESQWEK